jgi:CubicO group peptidase (beta-lactamase class C family)
MSAPALPRAEPESVGLSSARLRRIGEALRRDIEAGQLPGAVIGIVRAGKLAHLEAVGHRDPATSEPLKTDSIFSIASMTKAMTSTAIMLLVEEGRVLLADPVSKYLPPLAELKVAEPGGGTRAPKQLPTIQDLLRHTSGFTYRDRGTTPAHALYPGSPCGRGSGCRRTRRSPRWPSRPCCSIRARIGNMASPRTRWASSSRR